MSSLTMSGKELDSAERVTMKNRNQEEHEMGRMKGLAAILGVAVLMAVVAACGNGAGLPSLSDEVPIQAPPVVGGTTPTASNPPTTPIVSHGGPVNDYISLVDNLRAAGAVTEPAGIVSQPFFAPQGQWLTVNGEDVQTFEFASAEEADAAAEGVSAGGSSISRVDSETGMGVSTMVTWVAPPHFYKAGKLIAIYVGCDSDVINVLQETMGRQFAGGAGLSQCPDQVPSTTMEIHQALEAAEGSEVTVSGFLIVEREGNTRLCSGLLESFPPQCGGDRIDLLGFDASSVPDTSTPQSSSEIQTVRWTNHQITVTGIKGSGGLAEVRLSTEAPTIQRGPGAPAPTVSNPRSSPIVSHGGPVAAGSPRAILFIDGVNYTDSSSLRVAPGEPTAFVIDGVDVNVAKLEVVGTTTQGPAGSIAGLPFYRSTVTGDANAVYTFTPAQRTVNPEDGQIFESPAQWVRWTASGN